jgi:hypothetical protein
MIADSRITWKRQHVKGHHDIPLHQLDILVRANYDCCTDANYFWAMCIQHHWTIEPMYIDNGPWSIWSEYQMLATNMGQVLYHKIHSPKTQARWRDRGFRPSETLGMVDWTALEQAAKSVPEIRRIWVMKYKHGMCGTGQFMMSWNYRHFTMS